MVGAWGPGGGVLEGDVELMSNGTGFRFEEMDKFWRWMVLIVAQQRECP